MEPGEFKCSVCDKKPALKLQNGCDAPPTLGNGEWRFPEMKPRAIIDRCPLKFVTGDVRALFQSMLLADGKMSVSEQLSLPVPYVYLFSLAAKEGNEAHAARMERKAKTHV